MQSVDFEKIQKALRRIPSDSLTRRASEILAEVEALTEELATVLRRCGIRIEATEVLA